MVKLKVLRVLNLFLIMRSSFSLENWLSSLMIVWFLLLINISNVSFAQAIFYNICLISTCLRPLIYLYSFPLCIWLIALAENRIHVLCFLDNVLAYLQVYRVRLNEIILKRHQVDVTLGDIIYVQILIKIRLCRWEVLVSIRSNFYGFVQWRQIFDSLVYITEVLDSWIVFCLGVKKI